MTKLTLLLKVPKVTWSYLGLEVPHIHWGFSHFPLARRDKPQIDNDNDSGKPIKSHLKGKGLLLPVGLARLDS
jgi:hypothetical protein